MAKRYSRRIQTEHKKNIKSAYVFIVLTIVAFVLFVFYGLPAFIKFAAFLSDINQSSEPIEINDTTPPPPPRFEPFPDATDKLRIDIKGNTEPGASVIITANGKEEGILSNKDGDFTYTFTLNDGKNTISAYAKDAAGNESKQTEKYVIYYDNEPPDLEITKPADGSQLYGSRERQVVIEGNTEPGVSISINGRIVVVDSDGNFFFTTTLSEGDNIFNINAQDKAGNISEEQITLTFFP